MLAALLSVALAPQDPQVATVQVPEPLVVTSATMQDIDLDGATDLVVATTNPSAGTRAVQVHLRRARGPAFVPTPTSSFKLDRSVVAFAFCDCDPAPGRELVLITATTAAAAIQQGDGPTSYRELFRHALVWPAASPLSVVPLPDAAADLDGDGRDDLLLPGPDRWSAWLQAEERFVEARLELPAWRDRVREAVGGEMRDLGDRLGFTPGGAGALVRTSARTPPAAVVDLDGDGRVELLAPRNGAVFVGALDAQRAIQVTARALPLPEDRLQLVDPSFDLQWPDVDGDGRRDLLMTTSTSRDDEVEARVDLFLADAGAGWRPARAARLRMQPLGLPPQLVDADGDGDAELVCLSIRTSAMRAFTGATKATLDAQLTIFELDGPSFVRPAVLNVPLQVAAGRRGVGPLVRVRPGRNGAPGDVLIGAGARLERRLLGRRSGRLRLANADASAGISDGARVVVADSVGDDVLVVTDREVRHVRFRR
jgi:hypothetical protein